MAAGGVGDPRVEAAFAAVAREDFLGPWHIVRWGGGYPATPDADAVYLYTDDVIGILPERNLNNGQHSLHAALITAATPRPGERVVHVSAGVGYYTAILAELVGVTRCRRRPAFPIMKTGPQPHAVALLHRVGTNGSNPLSSSGVSVSRPHLL
jgi:protein-L-isoaspartate O-methyltransferase